VVLHLKLLVLVLILAGVGRHMLLLLLVLVDRCHVLRGDVSSWPPSAWHFVECLQ
jgi:hypothetical protein